jgi:hypothetical protein
MLVLVLLVTSVLHGDGENMPNNPKNGMPSTLCPGCGYWNDWQKIPGATKHKWEKPYQCEKRYRQLKNRHNPGAGRPSASDQIGIYGQRQLTSFTGVKRHG